MAKKKAGRPPFAPSPPVSVVDRWFVEVVKHFGNSQTETANALGCSQSYVWSALTRTNKESIAPVFALRAELASKGKFRCDDLCPELGELVGSVNKNRLCAGKPPIGAN